MTSVKITSLAVVLPELVMVEVKVSVSPIVANVELTVLFIDRVASTIGVTVVLVIVLPTAGIGLDLRYIHNLQAHYLLMYH